MRIFIVILTLSLCLVSCKENIENKIPICNLSDIDTIITLISNNDKTFSVYNKQDSTANFFDIETQKLIFRQNAKSFSNIANISDDKNSLVICNDNIVILRNRKNTKSELNSEIYIRTKKGCRIKGVHTFNNFEILFIDNEFCDSYFYYVPKQEIITEAYATNFLNPYYYITVDSLTNKIIVEKQNINYGSLKNDFLQKKIKDQKFEYEFSFFGKKYCKKYYLYQDVIDRKKEFYFFDRSIPTFPLAKSFFINIGDSMDADLVEFSEDENYVLLELFDNSDRFNLNKTKFNLFDFKANKFLFEDWLDKKNAFQHIVFSPDNKYLIFYGVNEKYNKNIQGEVCGFVIWDLLQKKIVKEEAKHWLNPIFLNTFFSKETVFGKNGNFITETIKGDTIQLWNINNLIRPAKYFLTNKDKDYKPKNSGNESRYSSYLLHSSGKYLIKTEFLNNQVGTKIIDINACQTVQLKEK